MKRSIVVSNANNGIKEALEKFRSRFLNENDYLITSRETKVETIAAKLAAGCVGPNSAREYEICAIVFVINGTETILDEFRTRLSGALFLNVPFRFERAHNHEYLQLVQFIQQELRHARKLIQSLKKEFTERDSRTPLLLPIQNFRSRALDDLVRDVQKFRPQDQDYDRALRKLIDTKGLQSSKDGPKKSYFENRNSIRFYGPSKAGARHGAPIHFETEPHAPTCLVNGYFRLGARYHVNFHYDCHYGDDTRVSGEFRNCHGGLESLKSRTHLNISPNDFIR